MKNVILFQLAVEISQRSNFDDRKSEVSRRRVKPQNHSWEESSAVNKQLVRCGMSRLAGIEWWSTWEMHVRQFRLTDSSLSSSNFGTFWKSSLSAGFSWRRSNWATNWVALLLTAALNQVLTPNLTPKRSPLVINRHFAENRTRMTSSDKVTSQGQRITRDYFKIGCPPCKKNYENFNLNWLKTLKNHNKLNYNELNYK